MFSEFVKGDFVLVVFDNVLVFSDWFSLLGLFIVRGFFVVKG